MNKDQIPAAIVSVIVLLMFGGVLVMVFRHAIPEGSEAMINILMGTLGTMATSTVAYWVGSTANSANKDKTIARQGEIMSGMQPAPAPTPP